MEILPMSKSFRALAVGGLVPRTVPADAMLTVLRVAAGLMMATHGWAKVPVSNDFVQSVEGMGFPLPVVFAWMAALSELVGGVLLAAGLFTRFAAFMIAGTMVVAAFIVHAGDPLGARELALLYLAVCIAFIGSGSGRFSIDAMLRRPA